MKLRDGTPEQAGVSASQVRKILERSQSWVDEGIHPTLVILAARRGVIFLHEAIGQLGPQADSPPVKPSTIFPLASISKPFTAAVAMTLVEDGLLGLNRPVADYLPAFLEGGKGNILIRNLMTHTSGIQDEDVIEKVKSDHPEKDDYAAFRWLNEHFDEYVDIIVHVPHTDTPDTVMRYADTNYDLLGEVIRKVTGATLEEFATERIFSPLGMKDTHYLLPREKLERVVKRANTSPANEGIVNWQELEIGSASLHTTTRDAAIFAQMLLNRGLYREGKILSAASIRAMTEDQIPGIGAMIDAKQFPHAHWGLGWSINGPFKGPLYGEPMLSSSAIGHGGAGGVFIWVDPAHEIVAVYFSVLPNEEHLLTKGCADLFINMVMAGIEEI